MVIFSKSKKNSFTLNEQVFEGEYENNNNFVKINKLKLKEELLTCANKEKLLGEKNFLEARLERHTKKYRNIILKVPNYTKIIKKI